MPSPRTFQITLQLAGDAPNSSLLIERELERSVSVNAAAFGIQLEIHLRITDNLALGSLELAAAAKLKAVGAQHVAAARRAQWPS